MVPLQDADPWLLAALLNSPPTPSKGSQTGSGLFQVDQDCFRLNLPLGCFKGLPQVKVLPPLPAPKLAQIVVLRLVLPVLQSTLPNPVSRGPSRGVPSLGCEAFEKLSLKFQEYRAKVHWGPALPRSLGKFVPALRQSPV